MIQNCFTVDVEDYFQVNAFSDRIDPKTWGQIPSRVEQNTHRILKLMEKHQVLGTFFILGWVADKFPGLVRDIQKAGHEIGCHGYWHGLIYDLTPEQFREEVSLSTKILTEITGEPIRSFRAPCFSITRKSEWALDILIEQGYVYDSSVFPVYHDNYGIPNAERFPSVIQRESGSLLEFPPTVYRWLGYNLPIAGGGYFRLYPQWFSMRLFRRINQKFSQPFMFYVHPWEVDPDQPRIKASLRSRFRHYQNLRSTAGKLDRLLSSFSFATMAQILQNLQESREETPRLEPAASLH